MNKIISKFLWAGDKFMPKLHLRQPGYLHSAGRSFTKHCQRIKKFKEMCILNYIYKNELDKACFANDAPYSDSKHLAKRTTSYFT